MNKCVLPIKSILNPDENINFIVKAYSNPKKIWNIIENIATGWENFNFRLFSSNDKIPAEKY